MARLLLFAAAREAAGCREADVPAASVAEALDAAVRRFGPAFSRLLDCSTVLVGERVVSRDQASEVAVGDADEIAVLPPVSGGTCTLEKVRTPGR